MITEAHKHEPQGETHWLVVRDDYSLQSAKCPCGAWLVRETEPVGSRYNWKNWRVTQ